MRSDEDAILDWPGYLDRLGLTRFTPRAAAYVCELCGGADAVTIRQTVRVTDTLRTRFATLCCTRCGLLVQSPRFPRGFYAAYYARVYRRMVGGAPRPSDSYVADQMARGASLFDSLRKWLPPRGRLLDVGCGAGGLMIPFLQRGWSVHGVDPDKAAVAHGINRLGLAVTAGSAETMKLARAAYDLIVITGSLEHVHDPNAVLRRCHDAAAPGSLLLVEAHGLGQAALLGAIGHNHRRLLTGTTMALLLLRHGWTTEWITDAPLCGPTRPGSTFILGRYAAPGGKNGVAAAIDGGVRDTPEAMTALLGRLAID